MNSGSWQFWGIFDDNFFFADLRDCGIRYRVLEYFKN